MDGLESRANSWRLCGDGIAHHCALLATRRRCGVIELKAECDAWSPRIELVCRSSWVLMPDVILLAPIRLSRVPSTSVTLTVPCAKFFPASFGRASALTLSPG